MKRLLLAVACILLTVGVAGADYILDTGNNPSYIYNLLNYEWLAGEFTTTQTWDFGAMQGDIWTVWGAGQIDISIRAADNGTLPGSVLFTKSFQSQPVGFSGWQGTTGYAGTLPAGTYWISFEVTGGSTFGGNMGGLSPPTNGAMSPEALCFTGAWQSYTLNIPARIEGTAVVPIPGAFLLLGSGLLGLIGLSRKFKG
jgi:hypothetical protein